MSHEEPRAVAEGMMTEARDAYERGEGVDLDAVIARVAPNARKVAYEVPAVEMDAGDGHMHYTWDEPQGS